MKVCPSCFEVYGDDASYCPDDGTGLSRSRDRYLGRTVASRYRLVRRLGQGGMSQVYLAKHVIIGRMSAIKILREDLGLSASYRERFLREARAVNRINHRNIIEISDVGEADGIAYLVMEYVEGESLLAHIERGPFPWARAIRIAAQIASALARAHQLGVIHRDLKPENVMIVKREDGTDFVKLTDFGIAKILDMPALTFSEQLFGTPGYIAPEIVEGKEADHRVDLYSLGVLLYEMLSGSLPFDARGQAELLLKPLSCDPVPLSTRVAGVPAELEGLVLRMLERERDKRPDDAVMVQERLLEIARTLGEGGDRISLPELLGDSPTPREAFSTMVESETLEGRRVRYASKLDDADGVAQPSDPRMPRRTQELRSVIEEPGFVAQITAAVPPSEPRGQADSVENRVPAAYDAPVSIRVPTVASMMPPAFVGMAEDTPAPAFGGDTAIARWHAAIADLEASIVRCASRGISPATASEAQRLAENARAMTVRVARTSDAVRAAQIRVDALQRKAREFRGSLGRAVDILLRDRSRHRIRRDSLRGARDSVHLGHPGEADESLWEAAHLAADRESLRAIDADLSFQIETLQRELDRRNQELEHEMVEASAILEGSVSAFRSLTSELARTLDEAARAVSSSYARRVRPLA